MGKIADKKHILTYAGLEQYEGELQNLRVVKRKEIAQKIKEAREQGDLSEDVEYNAAKDEQRDVELHIEELKELLKDVEVVAEGEIDLDKINIGCKVKFLDVEYDEETEFYIIGSTEADSLQNKINDESPVGRALIDKAVDECVDVEAQARDIQYKMLEIQRVS